VIRRDEAFRLLVLLQYLTPVGSSPRIISIDPLWWWLYPDRWYPISDEESSPSNHDCRCCNSIYECLFSSSSKGVPSRCKSTNTRHALAAVASMFSFWPDSCDSNESIVDRSSPALRLQKKVFLGTWQHIATSKLRFRCFTSGLKLTNAVRIIRGFVFEWLG
jgi:hypothetical protein